MSYCKKIKSWANDDTFMDICPKIKSGQITIADNLLTIKNQEYENWWEYCEYGKCRSAAKDCNICSYPESLYSTKILSFKKHYICEDCVKMLDQNFLSQLKSRKNLVFSVWKGKQTKKFFEEQHYVSLDSLKYYKVIKPKYNFTNSRTKYLTLYAYPYPNSEK